MLKDLILMNRSYRGYDENRKITREELLDIVDCARFSASSVNQQPLRYYLAWKEEDVARVQSLTHWAKQLPELELPHKGMYPTAFIVICQDMNVWNSLARFQRDVGIAAQSMLLRATEMGLGGCMIGNFNASETREVLQLSENLSPLLIVAIGKPAEKIVLKEISPEESTAYYRDENDVHYVPKRRLEDIIIN